MNNTHNYTEQLPLFFLSEQEVYDKKKNSIDELLSRSLKFRGSAEFRKFFSFIARFKHYSRYNTMLVYIQNSAVTFFGGVSYWKKNFNRTIKDDARPYIILAPNGPVMLVYDVMDTEGKLSADEFIKTGLGREVFGVEGVFDEVIYYNAIERAMNYGIKIKIVPQDLFSGGSITTSITNNLEIKINGDLNLKQRFPILIHELAHLLLGHTGHKEIIHYKHKSKIIKIKPRTKLGLSTKELEAETVSFLVCNKLGIITDADKYIAGYHVGEKALKNFSHDAVIKVTDKIEKTFISRIKPYY